MELATVMMQVDGPALQRVLHNARHLPGIPTVQSRFEKSTLRHPSLMAIVRYDGIDELIEQTREWHQ